VYKDGVEVYNTSSSGAAGVRESSSPDSATGASATGADGAASCRCVVGDKLSCAVQLNDDKQFTVTFTNNDHKVLQHLTTTTTTNVFNGEWVSPHKHIIGHFGDESFQSITDSGLLHLHEADEAAVDWLTTYGS